MNYVLSFVIIMFTVIKAVNPDIPNSPLRSQDHIIWDENQISTWHGNHGDVVSYHAIGRTGLEWPIGSGIGAVYQSGLWLGAGRINGV